MFLSIVIMLSYGVLMIALLFGSAGRWDFPMVWAYVVVTIAPSLPMIAILHKRSPGLIEERLRPGPGEQDRLSKWALAIGYPAHWIIAGLDIGRFHWSDLFPLGAQVAGLAGYSAGLWLSMWAMLVNPFFSSAVRIQADRQQYVIQTGPYRYIRHPGYTGGLLFLICSALALGSWWALPPILLLIPFLLHRAKLEDLLLQRELKGYADYAGKVRYRLIPGVW